MIDKKDHPLHKIHPEAHAALHTLVHGNPLLHPVMTSHIHDSLIQSGFARQVLGGGLKATNSGMELIHGVKK